MNLNKVFILGRVTADPVLKSTPTGMQVVNFSVATNRVWNDKSGTRKEDTEFHSVVVWGRQAEVASRFLKKGGLVLIEGRLQTRTWEDKTGQKRKTTEIVCENMQLGPKSAGSGVKNTPSSDMGAASEKDKDVPTIEIGEESEDVREEDLPF
ncbi:MAG: single-stranded DNA-binding protein [Patescibacteria group bacterium]|nr:single-stranded DNA-binding protein [Patescibacteria group bacterium]